MPICVSRKTCKTKSSPGVCRVPRVSLYVCVLCARVRFPARLLACPRTPPRPPGHTHPYPHAWGPEDSKGSGDKSIEVTGSGRTKSPYHAGARRGSSRLVGTSGRNGGPIGHRRPRRDRPSAPLSRDPSRVVGSHLNCSSRSPSLLSDSTSYRAAADTPRAPERATRTPARPPPLRPPSPRGVACLDPRARGPKPVSGDPFLSPSAPRERAGVAGARRRGAERFRDGPRGSGVGGVNISTPPRPRPEG